MDIPQFIFPTPREYEAEDLLSRIDTEPVVVGDATPDEFVHSIAANVVRVYDENKMTGWSLDEMNPKGRLAYVEAWRAAHEYVEMLSLEDQWRLVGELNLFKEIEPYMDDPDEDPELDLRDLAFILLRRAGTKVALQVWDERHDDVLEANPDFPRDLAEDLLDEDDDELDMMDDDDVELYNDEEEDEDIGEEASESTPEPETEETEQFEYIEVDADGGSLPVDTPVDTPLE